jgi:hypothetical protein
MVVSHTHEGNPTEKKTEIETLGISITKPHSIVNMSSQDRSGFTDHWFRLDPGPMKITLVLSDNGIASGCNGDFLHVIFRRIR